MKYNKQLQSFMLVFALGLSLITPLCAQNNTTSSSVFKKYETSMKRTAAHWFKKIQKNKEKYIPLGAGLTLLTGGSVILFIAKKIRSKKGTNNTQAQPEISNQHQLGNCENSFNDPMDPVDSKLTSSLNQESALELLKANDAISEEKKLIIHKLYNSKDVNKDNAQGLIDELLSGLPSWQERKMFLEYEVDNMHTTIQVLVEATCVTYTIGWDEVNFETVTVPKKSPVSMSNHHESLQGQEAMTTNISQEVRCIKKESQLSKDNKNKARKIISCVVGYVSNNNNVEQAEVNNIATNLTDLLQCAENQDQANKLMEMEFTVQSKSMTVQELIKKLMEKYPIIFSHHTNTFLSKTKVTAPTFVVE